MYQNTWTRGGLNQRQRLTPNDIDHYLIDKHIYFLTPTPQGWNYLVVNEIMPIRYSRKSKDVKPHWLTCARTALNVWEMPLCKELMLPSGIFLGLL